MTRVPSELIARIATLDARLQEQDKKIQRVNDRVELSRPGLQTVGNR